MKKDYNDARDLLKKMRTGKFIKEEQNNDTPPKELTMRDLLGKTRNMKEQEEEAVITQNKKTDYDQNHEEEKFRNFFKDLNVNVDFVELEVYNNLIFWGGTVDGVVQFTYKVTPEENTSGVEFNYLEGFSIDDPDNDEIVKKIETYYDSFYKYWRNNVLDA